MGKLSDIKATKTRVVSGTWTPASTPIVGPAPFNPLYNTNTTLSNSNYTATGNPSGYVFTGLGLPHDATLRGHTVTLDITGIQDQEGLYIGSINGNDLLGATDSHLFLLVWNAGNGNFDVQGGNAIGDAPVVLGSMSYTNGQELAFGTSWDGVDGYLALYKDGVLQFSMNPAVPMTDASVSFGVYLTTSTPIQATIVQTPAFPVPAITQYTTSVPGPISYPPNRAGKIFEVEGVAPGGIVVEGFRLYNGNWAEFDQNLALVPPLEPEVPYLTEASADLLYSPLITNFYGQMTAPGPNDDSTIGAMIGSKWQDISVSPNEWYICSDASVGAAVWIQLSLTPDELGSMALQSAGSGPTEYRDNAAQDIAIATAISNIPSSAPWTEAYNLPISISLGSSGVYNYLFASTGGIVVNGDAPVTGVEVIVFHNHTTEPFYPFGWVKIGPGTYSPSQNNVIYAKVVGNSKVHFTITQEV